MVSLWLRHEIKEDEHRAALSPDVCQKLISNGFKISVERSTERCFTDEEYAKVGCTLVETNSWDRDADLNTFIVGLKELPEPLEGSEGLLRHRHIYFGHCYKGQQGSSALLARFSNAKGTLLDMEFLVDQQGRRVAAFGYAAGFGGSAIGIDVWAHRALSSLKTAPSSYPPISPFPSEQVLVKHIHDKLQAVINASSEKRYPRVHVIGALGRCGGGAIDLALKVGIPEENIIRWDLNETNKGGPFPEILESDIFINCIYLMKPIPPFLTKELLAQPGKLSVIVDVSCDVTNPHNPLPIYNKCTTFKDPLLTIPKSDSSTDTVDIIAIDHLPTLLPRESSERFSNDLFLSFLELKDFENSRVWQDAAKLFHSKVTEYFPKK